MPMVIAATFGISSVIRYQADIKWFALQVNDVSYGERLGFVFFDTACESCGKRLKDDDCFEGKIHSI